jgi:hypothetical protein
LLWCSRKMNHIAPSCVNRASIFFNAPRLPKSRFVFRSFNLFNLIMLAYVGYILDAFPSLFDLHRNNGSLLVSFSPSKFVLHCNVCQLNNSEHTLPAGLLQPFSAALLLFQWIFLRHSPSLMVIAPYLWSWTVSLAHFIPLSHPFSCIPYLVSSSKSTLLTPSPLPFVAHLLAF